MRKYDIEVSNESNWERYHRIISVQAEDVVQAYQMGIDQKGEDEDIYQISREFSDCSLPQPVYDFLNGFMNLDEAKFETWSDYLFN